MVYTTSLGPSTLFPRPAILLLDQKLLALIFSWLLPSDPTSLPREDITEGRRQLSFLAFTCTIFKEPALDCLWTCLDSLVPLIKLLPNLHVVNNAYYFRGGLPIGCAFRRHASRVRVLDLRPVPNATSSAPSVSAHTYILLSSELHGQPLFPFLHKLHVQTSENPINDFIPLPLLYSSPIESLKFSGKGLSNVLFMEYCLPLAVMQLPSLKHLSLHNNATKEQDVDAVFKLILGCVNLKSLDLQFALSSSRFTPDSLTRAGFAFQEMTSLTLNTHFANHQLSGNELASWQNAAANKPSTMFPKLTFFHAYCRAEKKFCQCIPPFLVERMTDLTLQVRNVNDSNYFKAAMDTLVKVPTLRRVDIVNKVGEWVEVQRCDAILPFFRLPGLVEFKVDVSSINYHTELLQAIISGAFSPRGPNVIPRGNLRSLFLPAKGEDRRIGLDALSDLAEAAIGLETLTLGFASHSSGSARLSSTLLQKWKLAPPSESTLRYLYICEQRDLGTFNAQDYDDLAQLLDLMFPRLVFIKPFRSSDVEAEYWKRHWWFIERLRKMHKNLRIYGPSN